MAAKPANSMNQSSASGIVTWDGTSVQSTVAMTQYDVLTGGATANAINQVAPSATAGVPLISKGSSTQPAFGTAVVGGGGTGNTTFTAYSIICAGTTATGVFQNVVGVGSAGNILRSAGASALPAWTTTTYPATNAINTIMYATAANVLGSIAAANNGVLITSASGVPSFLADGTTGQVLTATAGAPPAWAAPATPSGSLVLIQKQTPSAQSSISFTSIPSTYDCFVLVSYGVTASGTDQLVGQFSYNNGVSWLTGADYVIGLTQSTAGGSGNNWASGQTNFVIINEVNASANCQSVGTAHFYNITNGSYFPTMTATSNEVGGNYEFFANGCSYYGSAGAVNAIKIFCGSGSTFSGTFKLYGVVN